MGHVYKGMSMPVRMIPHSVKERQHAPDPGISNKSRIDRHKLHVFCMTSLSMGYQNVEAYRGPCLRNRCGYSGSDSLGCSGRFNAAVGPGLDSYCRKAPY